MRSGRRSVVAAVAAVAAGIGIAGVGRIIRPRRRGVGGGYPHRCRRSRPPSSRARRPACRRRTASVSWPNPIVASSIGRATAVPRVDGHGCARGGDAGDRSGIGADPNRAPAQAAIVGVGRGCAFACHARRRGDRDPALRRALDTVPLLDIQRTDLGIVVLTGHLAAGEQLAAPGPAALHAAIRSYGTKTRSSDEVGKSNPPRAVRVGSIGVAPAAVSHQPSVVASQSSPSSDVDARAVATTNTPS